MAAFGGLGAWAAVSRSTTASDNPLLSTLVAAVKDTLTALLAEVHAFLETAANYVPGPGR